MIRNTKAIYIFLIGGCRNFERLVSRLNISNSQTLLSVSIRSLKKKKRKKMPKYDPSSVSPLQLPAHTRDVFPFEFGVTFRVLATTLHPISFIPPPHSLSSV